jgi:hypothetical protein
VVLQRRLSKARAAVLAERIEESKRQWLLTLASRRDACSQLSARLHATEEAVALLGAARSEETAMRRAYEDAAAKAGQSPSELAPLMDEPDWGSNIQRLIDFLSEGPLHPFRRPAGP